MNRIICILIMSIILFPKSTFAFEGMPANASTKGTGRIVVGTNPYNLNNTETVEGSINISVRDMGNRWSQLQNIDKVNVISEFIYDKSRYKIIIKKAMPKNPYNTYTTFFGVAYHENMNGDTFIGTSQLPKLKPDIALWGWAEVIRDDKVIAKMVPAHVKVMNSPPLKGIMLEVDTENKTLSEISNGYINVFWEKIDSLNLPETQKKQREWVGWGILVILSTSFLWLAVKER